MYGGLLGSRRSLAGAALALGACQSIIGVSNYDIDPLLDEAAGGKPVLVAGAGGQDGSEGGEPPNSGGLTSSSAGEGGTAPSSEAGAGGEAGGGSSTCKTARDCDDSIDCTVDACGPDGVCTHTANNGLCVADPGECLTCQVGIGCVAGTPRVQELLLDGSFDANEADWFETSDNFADQILFEEAGAHSGARVAKFGPAPTDATKAEYADLYQTVEIPANATGITLTGYYKLTPGTKSPASDYVVAAFYALGEVEPFSQLHKWPGSSGAQVTWKQFSYDASPEEVSEMAGDDYTFDFVTRTFGSVYRFDTVSLKATLCE